MSHVERAGLQWGESPMADSEKIHLSIDELHDLYDVERQLTRALSKLPPGGSWSALRDAFETHLTQTQREIRRLEGGIESLWEKVRNHRDDLPPSTPDATVRISVRSSVSTGSTGLPHSREDYDAGDADTLLAWARAIGDDEFADDRSDIRSDRTGSRPSIDN